MYQVIIIFHVLVSLSIISLVLMQQGRGADAGAAFGGGGSSGSVFGAQGSASFLSSTTAVFAVIFFCTSLGLAILSGQQEVAVDLMDAPEAEQEFLDVPLVTDDEEPMRVPSISTDQTEEIPAVISEEAVVDSLPQVIEDSTPENTVEPNTE